MKRIGLITIFWITYISLLCAQGNGTYHQFDLEVDGLARQYTLYVPEGYDGVGELPVVFCLHGMSCSILQMQEMTKLYLVADTARFFIVYPQGLSVYLTWFDFTSTGWNVPDYFVADQNDVAFISQIIDDLNNNSDISIDLNRIHATGLSAGGAMAHYLAFELSNRIASVASVSGQISDTLINHICDPMRPISVLHMQGTKDGILPDTGDYYCLPLNGVTDYWAGINVCNAIPDTIEIEDIEISDSSTVTLFKYGQCNDDLEVLLYRINGGGHTWPGGYEDPSWGWGQDIINMDINASIEIWNFFKRNPHPYPLQVSSINNFRVINIYPNPTNIFLTVETGITGLYNIDITTLSGQLIFSKEMKGTSHQIDLSSLPKGVYFITIRSKYFVTTKKIIKL